MSLYNFFKLRGYSFYKECFFSPRLNNDLKKILLRANETELKRKKQILIYGRPSKNRNVFSLILMALDKWYSENKLAREWQVLSVGESFGTIKCPSGLEVKSLGKLTIEEYANEMLQSQIGISLMASPHPSYPPLEMASFGLKVITNNFANKDLGKFSTNIYSLKTVTIEELSKKIVELSSQSDCGILMKTGEYLDDDNLQWNSIYKEIRETLETGN